LDGEPPVGAEKSTDVSECTPEKSAEADKKRNSIQKSELSSSQNDPSNKEKSVHAQSYSSADQRTPACDDPSAKTNSLSSQSSTILNDQPTGTDDRPVPPSAQSNTIPDQKSLQGGRLSSENAIFFKAQNNLYLFYISSHLVHLCYPILYDIHAIVYYNKNIMHCLHAGCNDCMVCRYVKRLF
jgi:hypothetical protein